MGYIEEYIKKGGYAMPPPTIVNILTVEVYFGGILQKNSMKERIKELFLALKKKRLLNKMNRINPNVSPMILNYVVAKGRMLFT